MPNTRRAGGYREAGLVTSCRRGVGHTCRTQGELACRDGAEEEEEEVEVEEEAEKAEEAEAGLDLNLTIHIQRLGKNLWSFPRESGKTKFQ